MYILSSIMVHFLFLNFRACFSLKTTLKFFGLLSFCFLLLCFFCFAFAFAFVFAFAIAFALPLTLLCFALLTEDALLCFRKMLCFAMFKENALLCLRKMLCVALLKKNALLCFQIRKQNKLHKNHHYIPKKNANSMFQCRESLQTFRNER